MKYSDTIDRIIEKEWGMFRVVNGDTRVDCQEDRTMFERMRGAQFTAWSENAVNCYFDDLTEAEAAGRNLVREKYIRMMSVTDPVGYAAFKYELPELTTEQKRLISKIWEHMLAQTEKMREKYPAVALGGRPLRAGEETDSFASIETYQTCELATYSERTLKALLSHVEALEEKGIDLAFEIQNRSVIAMGYKDMEQAEREISFQFIQSMGGGECTKCGVYEDRC